MEMFSHSPWQQILMFKQPPQNLLLFYILTKTAGATHGFYRVLILSIDIMPHPTWNIFFSLEHISTLIGPTGQFLNDGVPAIGDLTEVHL